MTRKSQNRTLAFVIAGLLILIGLAFVARLAGGNWLAFYELVRDTSLLLVTVVAAYMAHIFQKRATFLQSLRNQWRDIVETKAALIYYCHLESPSLEDYLRTARRLSSCIDNMRIVYANVGETETLVGLYPYEPLHDMRRDLEDLDPRQNTPSSQDRYMARGRIWEAFKAIREHFLDEFELEAPTRPILVRGMRRGKQDGATPSAKARYEAQKRLLKETNGTRNH